MAGRWTNTVPHCTVQRNYIVCNGNNLINTCGCCVADPDPPTGVSVVAGTECSTAAVSWNPSQVNYNAAIGNYSVRYRLRSSTGGYTTVYSSSTSVSLRGLDPSMEYTVEVAAIDSCGRLSGFSMVTQLNLQGTSIYYLHCFTDPNIITTL